MLPRAVLIELPGAVMVSIVPVVSGVSAVRSFQSLLGNW